MLQKYGRVKIICGSSMRIKYAHGEYPRGRAFQMSRAYLPRLWGRAAGASKSAITAPPSHCTWKGKACNGRDGSSASAEYLVPRRRQLPAAKGAALRHYSQRLQQQIGVRRGAPGLLGEIAPPGTDPRQAGVQALYVPDHSAQPMPLQQARVHIGRVLTHHALTRRGPFRILERLVQQREQIRILIRLASDHDAIERIQVLARL